MGCMVYVEPFTLHLNRDRGLNRDRDQDMDEWVRCGLCRTFHTAPEEGQGPTPIVPIVLVSVPVPVTDTASVITPSVQCD